MGRGKGVGGWGKGERGKGKGERGKGGGAPETGEELLLCPGTVNADLCAQALQVGMVGSVGQIGFGEELLRFCFRVGCSAYARQ